MSIKLKDVELDPKSRDFVERMKKLLLEIQGTEGYEKKKLGVPAQAKREIIREKAESNFYFFVDKVMGVGEWKELKTGRKRLDPVMHGQMCRDISRMQDLLMLWPRNHMKSTIMKIFIIWLILKNPLLKIALFSLNRGLAKKELKSIKAMLSAPILREIWPDVVPPPKEWEVSNSTQLVMQRPEDCSIQESQIDVWGIDNNIAGHHYDVHCYDDIVDDKVVRSASQIEKIIDAWQMLQVVKDKSAIEIVVGTRYHLHDIYGHIIQHKFFKEENTVIRRCWDASGKPIYNLYTKKDLLNLKRKMGDANFATQMENDPVAASDKVFQAPYPIYDAAQIAKHVPLEHREYYAALDPAATAHQHSDQSGISIGFVDKRDPRCLFLERSYGVRLKTEKLAEEFIRIQVQYAPKYFGIETGLQTALQTVIQLKVKDWETANRRRLDYKILPISTGNTAKAVKFSRILAPFLNDRRILYPANRVGNQLELQPEFRAVEMQLNYYNPNSNKNDDDIIDSQTMIIQCCEHFSQAHWFNVKRDETDSGFNYDSIFKQFYSKGDDAWGSNMVI